MYVEFTLLTSFNFWSQFPSTVIRPNFWAKEHPNWEGDYCKQPNQIHEKHPKLARKSPQELACRHLWTTLISQSRCSNPECHQITLVSQPIDQISPVSKIEGEKHSKIRRLFPASLSLEAVIVPMLLAVSVRLKTCHGCRPLQLWLSSSFQRRRRARARRYVRWRRIIWHS